MVEGQSVFSRFGKNCRNTRKHTMHRLIRDRTPSSESLRPFTGRPSIVSITSPCLTFPLRSAAPLRCTWSITNSPLSFVSTRMPMPAKKVRNRSESYGPWRQCAGAAAALYRHVRAESYFAPASLRRYYTVVSFGHAG